MRTLNLVMRAWPCGAFGHLRESYPRHEVLQHGSARSRGNDHIHWSYLDGISPKLGSLIPVRRLAQALSALRSKLGSPTSGDQVRPGEPLATFEKPFSAAMSRRRVVKSLALSEYELSRV